MSAHRRNSAMAAPIAMRFRSAPVGTGIPARAASARRRRSAPRRWTGRVQHAGNSGTNGVRNQFDPYDIAWYDARQQRNGGHITVDQRLTSNISFYGSGFYSNRRATSLTRRT